VWPDRASVLPPSFEEQRWPQAACQTQTIVDRSDRGQFYSRSLRNKNFFLIQSSQNPYHTFMLIAISEALICLFWFESATFFQGFSTALAIECGKQCGRGRV